MGGFGSRQEAPRGGAEGPPVAGAACLALLVLASGLLVGWIQSPTRSPLNWDPGRPGCQRVELLGHPRLEGLYGVPEGTTLEGFLRGLGHIGPVVRRDTRREDDRLRDLSAVILVNRGDGFEVNVAPMQPGRAFLLGVPMDLNRAGSLDLMLLPGIGPALARRIVEERRRGGPFAHPDDLARVRGVSGKTVDAIRPLVRAETKELPSGQDAGSRRVVTGRNALDGMPPSHFFPPAFPFSPGAGEEGSR